MRDILIKIVGNLEELFIELRKGNKIEIARLVQKIDRRWNEFKMEISKTFF